MRNPRKLLPLQMVREKRANTRGRGEEETKKERNRGEK
jgi:hypothetical protein